MDEFRGRVALVTGAASGIGRGLAEHCADVGMRVVVADVDAAGLAETARRVEAAGAQVLAVPTDVRREEQVRALADSAEERFGLPHLLFNNAGVLTTGLSWECSAEEWEWVFDVNVMGVVHGIRTFVPRMLARGEPARVVNTASVGAFIVGPRVAPYVASKFAVAALSESLYYELRDLGAPVRVSVLCPGAVATGIGRSERVRPEEVRPGPRSPESATYREAFEAGIARGIDPRELARQAFDGIREDRFWILPDSSFLPAMEHRMRCVLEGREPGSD